MKLEQFNFSLPTELIAQIPAKKRDQSRLLVPTKEGLKDQLFSDLPRYFNKGDLFCLLYTSPSPRDRQKSRMPSSA